MGKFPKKRALYFVSAAIIMGGSLYAAWQAKDQALQAAEEKKLLEIPVETLKGNVTKNSEFYTTKSSLLGFDYPSTYGFSLNGRVISVIDYNGVTKESIDDLIDDESEVGSEVELAARYISPRTYKVFADDVKVKEGKIDLRK